MARAAWLVPLLVAVGSLLGAPFAACGVVMAVPGMGNEVFISAADGSTGPAFDLWIGSCLGVVVLRLLVSATLLARNVARDRDSRAH